MKPTATPIIVCILHGGRVLRLGRWTFEEHPQMGPVRCTKSGDPATRDFSPRDQFWRAYSEWIRQGSRVEEGVCVVQMPERWACPVPGCSVRVDRADIDGPSGVQVHVIRHYRKAHLCKINFAEAERLLSVLSA